MGSFSTQVEVEVRRNVHGSENAERVTSRFVGGESEVRNAVGDYLRWLKEDAQKRAGGFADDLKSAEVEIKRRLSPRMHGHTLDPPQPVAEEIHRSTSEPAGEDGWASDNSDTRTSRPTKPKLLGGKTAHSFKRKGSTRAKKYLRPSTDQTESRGEHSKALNDRSSTPSPYRHGPRGGTGISMSRTTSWDVNSPHHHSRPPSLHTDSRKGSVRNLRIESLRTAGIPGSPRELSPARSVRFADSHPPRTSLPIQDTSAAVTSQSGSGDKEEDTSRTGKVAFELPSDTR